MRTMIIPVVGVTFANEEDGSKRQDIIRKLSGEEEVYLKREPENKFDSNAVAVMVVGKNGDLKIGYIKAELARIFSEYWFHYKFNSMIKEIRNGGEKSPWGISLVIKRIKKKRKIKKRR